MCSKVMALNIKKSPSLGPYFPHLSHVACFAGFIFFWSHLVEMLNYRLDCHWNLNSTFEHSFAKLSLLRARAYVSVHKFDITCLSETYLDSSIDDENFEISGYYLIRSDHPSNKKRGGICICYKNFLPLKVTGLRLLEECIAFDLIISKKFVVLLHFTDHLVSLKAILQSFPITLKWP